jgi:hypothetical protein
VVGLFRIGGVAEMSQRAENISACGFNSSLASNYAYERFGFYGFEDIVTQQKI